MTVVASWPPTRAHARVERSCTAVATTRRRIEGWFSDRSSDEMFARFGTHFDVLRGVLGRMLERIDTALTALQPGVTPADPITAYQQIGSVYRQCAALDERTTLVGRIFDWYAPKYDQRLDGELVNVLLAADEVVRSCYHEPFDATRRRRPTGPLVYLDPRFDAVAIPRTSVPSDLRAPGDDLVGEYVAELTIPVVALPAVSVAEPWWLVLAAHETGHHVQRDLSPRLEADTRAALLAAAAEPPGDPDLAAFWSGWAWETFADAFAALTVGPSAAWAVEELQHGPPAVLVRAPRAGDRYPPPAVRTAMLGELARCAGSADPGPGADDVRVWLDALPAGAVPSAATAAVQALLDVTPRVAAALVDLSVDGVPLRRLCDWRLRYFAADGDVVRWSQALLQPQPVITGRSAAAAARIGIAAAVMAYRRASDQRATQPALQPEPVAELLRTLAGNVTAVLRTCGPPGTLAGEATVDVDTLADRLADRLLLRSEDPAG